MNTADITRDAWIIGGVRMSPQTTFPSVSSSRAQTRFILACVAAVSVSLEFVFNIHFSHFGFGFWLGVILTGLVYVVPQARRLAVGVVSA